MSLINEALKKAQKQRTGESDTLSSLPGIGGESTARIARRAKPVGFNSLMIRLSAIAVGLLIIVLGTIFTLRLVNSSNETPAKSTPVAKPDVTQTTPATASTPSSENTFKVRGVNSTNAPQATHAESPTPVIEAKPKPVEITPVPAPAPQIKLPPAPGRMESKSVAYIEGLRIAGIRASVTDSKVLMNDRVYRAGDTVEHELGLKLVAITPNSLTFENENGARYTRNF